MLRLVTSAIGVRQVSDTAAGIVCAHRCMAACGASAFSALRSYDPDPFQWAAPSPRRRLCRRSPQCDRRPGCCSPNPAGPWMVNLWPAASTFSRPHRLMSRPGSRGDLRQHPDYTYVIIHVIELKPATTAHHNYGGTNGRKNILDRDGSRDFFAPSRKLNRRGVRSPSRRVSACTGVWSREPYRSACEQAALVG